MDPTGPTMSFTVNVSDCQNGERIYMVGDLDELGGWSQARGIELMKLDAQTFCAALPLSFVKNERSFRFKFVRICEDGVHWEQGADREWRRPDVPLQHAHTTEGGEFRTQTMDDKRAGQSVLWYGNNFATHDWTKSKLASIETHLREVEARLQRRAMEDSEKNQAGLARLGAYCEAQLRALQRERIGDIKLKIPHPSAKASEVGRSFYSDPKIQQMMKTESEVQQQAEQKDLGGRYRSHKGVTINTINTKLPLSSPAQISEVLDQKVGELDARIQQLIKTKCAAVHEKLQSDLGARCWSLQREKIDDINGRAPWSSPAKISEVVDQKVGELDAQHQQLIKTECATAHEQLQSDLGGRCWSLQREKINDINGKLPWSSPAQISEVIDQKVGELDLRIQQWIKTESAAVHEQLQSDLGGRCRGLQRETINGINGKLLCSSPAKISEAVKQKVGELDVQIQQMIKTESAAVQEQLQSDLGGRCRALQREISDISAKIPRAKIAEVESRLARLEARLPEDLAKVKLAVEGSSQAEECNPRGDPPEMSPLPPSASAAPAQLGLEPEVPGLEFEGHSKPAHPEGELRRLTLKVEQDLWTARKANLPVPDRKKLLRTVYLEIHPDKNKDLNTHDCVTWFEHWKKRHLEWYFEPHDVPEELRRPGETEGAE
ncbi:unnamed protein product [Effrenium voratum]|nr:unnamed protein product [Effrenium voratum]